MSDRPARQVAEAADRLMSAMRECGCSLNNAYAPVTLITGRLDDWTTVAACEFQLSFNGYPNELVQFRVIEGAYHSFDLFSWKGKPIGPRSYLGHHLEPNRAATDEAREIVPP